MLFEHKLSATFHSKNHTRVVIVRNNRFPEMDYKISLTKDSST